MRASLLLLLALPTQGGGGRPASAPSPFERPPVDQDIVLVGKINEAILRGEDWLLATQGELGSWNREEHGARIGYTELVLYALASSGEGLTAIPPPGVKGSKSSMPHGARIAQAIERGLDFVKKEPFPQTYALSLLLLAIEARATPRWERAALVKMTPEERARYPSPRRLSDADKLRVAQAAEELQRNRATALWSYSKDRGTGDISNTQFALLGLRAAVRCGAQIPPLAWATMLDYFLAYQDDDGPSVTFDMPKTELPTPDRKIFETIAVTAKQRCWGYSFAKGGLVPVKKRVHPTDRPAAGFSPAGSGTHAAIGIASLQICRDELKRALAGTLTPTLLSPLRKQLTDQTPAIDLGIRDGLGWLAGHWTLEEDPGGGFPFYYLYSIERVGALLGQRFVAGHDWYREGAEILLRRQLKEGAWPSDGAELGGVGSPDPVNTSFALLFLRRATSPGVVTPAFR